MNITSTETGPVRPPHIFFLQCHDRILPNQQFFLKFLLPQVGPVLRGTQTPAAAVSDLSGVNCLQSQNKLPRNVMSVTRLKPSHLHARRKYGHLRASAIKWGTVPRWQLITEAYPMLTGRVHKTTQHIIRNLSDLSGAAASQLIKRLLPVRQTKQQIVQLDI